MEDLGYLGEEDGKPTCAQVIAEGAPVGMQLLLPTIPVGKAPRGVPVVTMRARARARPRKRRSQGAVAALGRAYARSFEQLEKLHRAVKSLNVDAVRTALAGGGDPNQGDAKDGKNTLPCR